MKIMYIDAQNIHKSLQDIGWIIDREQFFLYGKRKFGIDTIKIFFGYIAKYQKLYAFLHSLGYEVVYKETMILPHGEVKGNVDIDIAVHSILDVVEGGLCKAYLVTGDGDYNTLVKFFRERNVLGRVLIPHRNKASKLLKKSAGADIQILEDIKYFIEKKNPPMPSTEDFL